MEQQRSHCLREKWLELTSMILKFIHHTPAPLDTSWKGNCQHFGEGQRSSWGTGPMLGTPQQSCSLPPSPVGILASQSQDALSWGPVLRGDFCKSTLCFLHAEERKKRLTHGFVMIQNHFERRWGPGNALRGLSALQGGLG